MQTEGGKSQTRRYRRRLAFGLPFILLILVGGQGEFIPSPTMQTIGFALAVVCGVGAALDTLFDIRRTEQAALTKIVLAVFLQATVLVVVSYYVAIGIIFNLPDLYTRLYGVPAQQQIVAHNWRRGMKHCASVTIQEIPKYLGDICERQRVPNGAILTLDGIRSPLGFHVTRIEPLI